MIYDFSRGLLRHECIHLLIFTFGDEAASFATVKLIVVAVYSPTTVVNVAQNQLWQKTLIDILYKIWHRHFAVDKVCSTWIPHTLTKSQKDACSRRLLQTKV